MNRHPCKILTNGALVAMLAATAFGQENLQPGLIAEYHPLTHLSPEFPAPPTGQLPAIRRVEPKINLKATAEAIPGSNLLDHFFARWKGRIEIPADGDYSFYLESDDGSRLFIGGRLILDHGGLHGLVEKSAETFLTKGLHPIEVEYFDRTEIAACKLLWESAVIDKQIIPAGAFWHEEQTVVQKFSQELQPGLRAEYFESAAPLTDFPLAPPGTRPLLARVDAQINFERHEGEFSDTQLTRHFSIRWTGKLRAPADGLYTLFLESDDGSALYLNEQPALLHTGLHPMEEKSARLKLKAGDHDLRLEYFQGEGASGCKLSWEAPGLARQIIPADALFHYAPGQIAVNPETNPPSRKTGAAAEAK